MDRDGLFPTIRRKRAFVCQRILLKFRKALRAFLRILNARACGTLE